VQSHLLDTNQQVHKRFKHFLAKMQQRPHNSAFLEKNRWLEFYRSSVATDAWACFFTSKRKADLLSQCNFIPQSLQM